MFMKSLSYYNGRPSFERCVLSVFADRASRAGQGDPGKDKTGTIAVNSLNINFTGFSSIQTSFTFCNFHSGFYVLSKGVRILGDFEVRCESWDAASTADS